MSKIVSFLALGVLPVSLVSLACPAHAAGRPGKKSVSASSARALSSFPAEVQKALSAGDYAGAQGALVDALVRLPNRDSRQGRHFCAALEVIRTASPDVMAAMHRAGKKAFLQAFLNDSAWMELYLGSGMVPYHNDVGLSILADIWELDGKSADFGTYKPLACALASVWGGEEGYKPVVQTKSRATHNPVWRYQFFKNRHKAGALYPGFERLRPWELRFVVAIPQQDWDDQSYAWCAENVNIPWQRYNAACWAAPYTDPNVFGDGVQTPDFYIGWPDESDAQKTQINGGVCGGLSHFGTVAAQAHGIPAYTVGQPGHCAYAVRLGRGNWIGGFGGPDGGMHNWVFSKGQAPTSFRLMEAVFADDANIDAAYRQAFQARALEAVLARADAKGKAPVISVQDVTKAWEKAVRLAPLHPHCRREFQKWLERSGMTPEAWLLYALETMRSHQGHGFAAIDVLQDVADRAMPQLSEAQRLEWLAASQKCLAGTPGSWALKLAPVLNKQMSYLTSNDARKQYLADLFTAHMGEGDGANFGAALEWGVEQFVDKGQEVMFAEAFQKAAATADHKASGQDRKRVGKMAQAYRKAILAAEKARSIPAFQTLTAAAAAMSPGEKRDTVKATLPGTLVSDQGAMRFSSNSGAYDKPETHGGLLTRQGGSYHSEREKTVEAVVALPKTEDISGVIVRKTDGNEWRMKRATLSTSTDGATWFPLAATNDMPKEWVVKAAQGTKARWVRIQFHNDGDQGEFAHISHFLIYKR